VAALIAPSRDWLITPPDLEVARPLTLAGRGPRVGPGDVYAVRAATKAFRELDHQFGSGYVRSIVVHYLDEVVGELLNGAYPERTGRALFAAAAQLTELAGYMAVDTGRHGLAQRYYIQALRLSQASGDRAYGGYVLAAGMSHLAGQLGSPREITQLARAAQEGAREQATATARSMFYAAEARGHAVLGDVRSCEAALQKAAAEMEKAEPEKDPEWIAHFTPAYLADEFAHCYRDLDRPRQAKEHAERALAAHAERHVRRRAVDTVIIATAYAQEREVEAACAAGTAAIDMLAQLRSHRGVEYLHDLDRRLDPYQESAAVRGFRERLGRLAVRQTAAAAA
jgi:microcompartment protein CcmL/EutN